MALPSPTPTRPATVASESCPACDSGDHTTVNRFGVREQLARYAGGDATVTEALVQLSGLSFGAYALRECTACGLRFSSPMSAPTGDWYTYVYDNLGMHAADRWEFDHVLGQLGAGDRLGEIGCGTGIFLGRARERQIPARGLDFSPGSVAACRAQGLDATTFHLDLDPFAVSPDRSVIASFHVLEHLQYPERLFDLAARWAAPGATLWIAVPSDRNMTRIGGMADLLDEPPHHLTQWTGEALRLAGLGKGWVLERLVYEEMAVPRRLWSLTTGTPAYRRLAGTGASSSRTRERLARYLLYPAVAAGRWSVLRRLSGQSMLARYRQQA